MDSQDNRYVNQEQKELTIKDSESSKRYQTHDTWKNNKAPGSDETVTKLKVRPS